MLCSESEAIDDLVTIYPFLVCPLFSFSGGMVLETNVKDIAAAVAGMEKHIQATENLSLSSSNSVQMGRRS
jgi:hypothetical protein